MSFFLFNWKLRVRESEIHKGKIQSQKHMLKVLVCLLFFLTFVIFAMTHKQLGGGGGGIETK